jgi:hypothetical protein
MFLKEFIEICLEQPCLWQVKSKDYKNEKNASYELLLNKLREVQRDASIEGLKKK